MLTKRDKQYIEAELAKIGKYLQQEAGPGMDKFSEITPHVFISNWNSGCNPQYLRDKSVELVVCVSKHKKSREELKLYNVLRIQQVQIPVEDTPRDNINAHFEKFYEMMLASIMEEKNILVHCQTGASSSVALVLYFLLKRYYVTNFGKKESLDRELVSMKSFKLKMLIEYMKERRTCIDPNLGFVMQLLTAELLLKKKFLAIFEAKLAEDEKDRLLEEEEDADERVARRTATKKKPAATKKSSIVKKGDTVKKNVKKNVKFADDSDELSSIELSDSYSGDSSDNSFERSRAKSRAKKAPAKKLVQSEEPTEESEDSVDRGRAKKTPIKKKVEVTEDSESDSVDRNRAKSRARKAPIKKKVEVSDEEILSLDELSD